MTSEQKTPISVFVVHTAQDEKHFRRLAIHLSLLIQNNLMTLASIATTPVNTSSADFERESIASADIILLLVTPTFGFLCAEQVKAALIQRLQRGASVIPMNVERVDDTLAPYAGLVRLPRNGHWLAEDRTEADWVSVSAELRNIIPRIEKPKEPPKESPRDRLPPPPPPGPVRFLFLTANTLNQPPLMVAREFATIEECRLGSRDRDKFELPSKQAVRSNQLIRDMVEYQPRLVHFSGHGSSGGIMLEDATKPGSLQVVSPAALGMLFKAINCVRCVVLSACYLGDRPEQAQALADVVGCAIAVSGVISDAQSLNFSIGFYESIFRNLSVGQAFDLGVANLAMANLPPAALKLFKGPNVNEYKLFLT